MQTTTQSTNTLNHETQSISFVEDSNKKWQQQKHQNDQKNLLLISQTIDANESNKQALLDNSNDNINENDSNEQQKILLCDDSFETKKYISKCATASLKSNYDSVNKLITTKTNSFFMLDNNIANSYSNIGDDIGYRESDEEI